MPGWGEAGGRKHRLMACAVGPMSDMSPRYGSAAGREWGGQM